jgi:predicted kinase
MLVVFSGLPGTGKTTIAHALAALTGALYLRIDTIEQAIRHSGDFEQDVGRSGYRVANQLALTHLRLGHRVIADCVNPVSDSRLAWQEVARQAEVALIDIEVICSDQHEHRRRVDTRVADIPGLVPPTWQSVLTHDYEPWQGCPFRVDTSQVTADEAVRLIVVRIEGV